MLNISWAGRCHLCKNKAFALYSVINMAVREFLEVISLQELVARIDHVKWILC